MVQRLSLFCCALFCVLHSFAIILKRKRELVALLLLSCECLVAVNDLCLFLAVLWVGLQCVVLVFPDNTHLFLKFQLGVGFAPYKRTCTCITFQFLLFL